MKRITDAESINELLLKKNRLKLKRLLMSALVWRGFSEWKKTKSGSHLVGRRWYGIWRRILEASLYCPEEVFTWSPYSCSDLAALCWVHTSRQPLGSFCSSSEQFCCTLAAFRWSLWTAPGGTRRQDVITNVLSYLHQFHRSAESVLCLTKGMAQGSFYLLCAPDFQTAGFLSQFHAWSPCLAHLQVDDSVCAIALHGVELQVPLEVLGVETRNGQTVAEASLYRETREIKGLRRLCSVTLKAALLIHGTNRSFVKFVLWLKVNGFFRKTTILVQCFKL